MTFKKKTKSNDIEAVSKSVEVIPPVDKRKTMPHLFKPGNSMGGRKKGSRSKLGEAFLSDLLEDWEEHGMYALRACRIEEPATYCRIVASILPKEINLNDEERVLEKFLEQFTTVEELREFRLAITSFTGEERSSEAGDTQERTSAKSRKQSDRVH